MSVKFYLNQANTALQSGRIEEAIASLKEAGALGDITAALDYAYFSAGSEPENVIRYLKGHPQHDIAVIRYHLALIDRFYYSREWNEDIIHILVQLAGGGHTESLLVLRSWCMHDASLVEMLNGQLARTVPTIYSQLIGDGACQSASAQVSFDKSQVSSAISERQAELDSLSFAMLDEGTRLRVTSGALSAFECRYVKRRFASLLGPSRVIHPLTGESIEDNIRTSQVATLSGELADWIIRDIDLRLASISGTVAANGEPLNLLCYQRGQQYNNHYDAFSEAELLKPATQNNGGQREFTAVAYLNSVEDGGATVFPRLNKALQPVEGSVVSFANVDDRGQILKNSYHAGLPAGATTKWTLTKWVRSEPTSYGKFAHGTFVKETKDV